MRFLHNFFVLFLAVLIGCSIGFAIYVFYHELTDQGLGSPVEEVVE